MENTHYISSEVLTLETLQEIISRHKSISLSEEARINIQKCREYLDKKLVNNDKPIYGINTGFGSLCNVKISNEELAERKAQWTAPALKHTKGILYKYAKSVASASKGCVTDA